MICPGCNQEHDDTQTCSKCAQEPKVNDPGAGKQPAADPAPPASSPSATTTTPVDAGGALQPDTTPTTNGDDPNGQPANPTTAVRIDINEISSGGGSTIAGILNQFQILERSQKIEEEKSLHDAVKPLTSHDKREYRPPDQDLQTMVQSLCNDRLILLSSSFTEYALDAAWEVIEALPPSPTRLRTRIAFEDANAKGLDFNIQKLCEHRSETENETVMLVEALHRQAYTFPASVLGNSAHVEAVKQDLKNSKLFLVVVVNHEHATEKELSQPKLNYLNFSYWNIPFLEPFLRHRFADHEQLLAELGKQRAKWEEDESSFTQQVVNYHANDSLRDIIKQGGPKDPEASAAALLKTADPVEKTVLYAATFFSEITSLEFCRVVESLLSTRTMLKDASVSTGEITPATAKIEVPLLRDWEDEKDNIFTSLLVETSASSDSPKTVSLAEFNLAEPLRKLFEKRHRFYLIDQFKALQQTGIFFYPSLRLSRNTTQLAVEMAQLYPDEFNEGWIVMLVSHIREYFATQANADDPMFHFLSNTELGAHLAFARVSEICQRFLESPPQKNVVPNSLEYMIRNDYDREVFWLVKQLKFNPEFDDWYWLKQLLHRADLKTKYQTYHYILSYLKQLGTGVYDGLERIEKWLPPVDRSNLTDFDIFIFRIVIKYCLDTINRFNGKHYGKWPSRYALFTQTNAEQANARFATLANCLLHAGVDRTLVSLNIDGTRIALIGILLAEWSFILLGTPQFAPKPGPNGKADQPNVEAQNCTATEMFELLIQQFLSRLDSLQRLELLKYWTHFDSALNILGHSHSLPQEQRDEMRWKETLVRRLLSELKRTKPAKPSTTNSPGSMVTSSHALRRAG